MATTISRVCVHAKPGMYHRAYHPYETADIVVFVQAGDRQSAIDRAREMLRRHRWEILEYQLCDRLIEDRVRDTGGEMWALYEQAVKDGAALKVFPKHFAPGPDGIPAILAPRVTEAFIDLVVQGAGGGRLATNDEDRMADYRIGDWVFELKDLQEEGLLQAERQQKLVKLFEPYATPGQLLVVDPEILSEEDRRTYFDILSSPIQGQVKSASKQIRSTKQFLGDDSLRGALIYLNTGYGSLPPDQFGPLVERYVRKDTTQIEAIFCASTWSVTNGFDTNVLYRTYPEESEHEVVLRLKRAFAERFEQTMTELVTGQLSADAELVDPLTPVSFSRNGLELTWLPPTLPFPWKVDA